MRLILFATELGIFFSAYSNLLEIMVSFQGSGHFPTALYQSVSGTLIQWSNRPLCRLK
jgi:hypothetical protein